MSTTTTTQTYQSPPRRTSNDSSKALSNNNWRLHRSPSPPAPLSQVNKLRLADAKLGYFANFTMDDLPQHSIIHQQPWITIGLSDHPVIIIGLKDDGRVAVCLPVTSFGQQTIQEKYNNAGVAARARILGSYMAIQQGDKTVPHNDMPVLQLADGLMLKQSYANMGGFFEIETCNLQLWNNNRTQHATIIFPFDDGREWTPEDLGISPRSTSPPSFSRQDAQAISSATTASSTKRGAVARVNTSTPYRISPTPSPTFTPFKRDLTKSWRRQKGAGIRKVSPLAIRAY
ncbi:hypothetical protein LTR85_009993 [Meristemomyces frigidus]|nr:hypothetical protein LTR85_009993 [Meristemomyces frigidus]